MNVSTDTAGARQYQVLYGLLSYKRRYFPLHAKHALTDYAQFPTQYLVLTREPGTVLLLTSHCDAENHRSYLFREPARVISARRAEDIPHAFAEIETAVAQGAFVAGFFSYECGYHFEQTGCEPPDTDTPLLWLGVYPNAYVFDHRLGKFEGNAQPLPAAEDGQSFSMGDLRFVLDEPGYTRRIERVLDYICAGDTYQVNFTGKMSFDVAGSSQALFAALQSRQPVAYSAYVNVAAETQILSFSPELFFRIRDGKIIARPMKGTAGRGHDAREDAAIADWLRHDAKNRAENVMIVDLLRNDLGKVCQFGSVQVDRLFAIERYETLFQMTSTVSGRLRSGLRYYDLFGSLFPCGSVTGAPKVRAMQIIRELEPCPRGVYTGAIGFISPKGRAVFSVPIRTIVLNGGRGQMGVGSGIVFDSTAADEYRECQLKAKFLASAGGATAFSLIESMLWNGGCSLLALHLERLQTSASELGFVFDKAAIMARLEANAKRLQLGIRYKVRLTLDRAGAVTVENTALTEGASNGRVVFSAVSTSSDDPFLRHKTTRRRLYDAMYQRARHGGYDDVLFLNERGEVTEGSISNVFIENCGRLYTPPLACGALPGVYRRHLLDTNSAAAEKTLYPEDLHSADAIYICNAVRGLRRVELDDNARLHHNGCSH